MKTSDAEKIVVDVDEIRKIKARLKYINSKEIENIEWVERGLPLQINKETLERWSFVGLNNVDFVDFVIDGDFRQTSEPEKIT